MKPSQTLDPPNQAALNKHSISPRQAVFPRQAILPSLEILMASLWGEGMAFGEQPEVREWKAPDGTVVKHRYSAPAKPEAGQTYPLALFLHGAGERGDYNAAQLKHGVIPVLQG